RHENDRHVRELLEDVVAVGGTSVTEAEEEVVAEGAPDRAELGPARHEIALQMPPQDGVAGERDPVEHEGPGKEKVPAAPHRQPLMAREGRPVRKAAVLDPEHPVAGGPQDAGGVKIAAKHARDALEGSPRHPLGAHGEDRSLPVRPLAPVERGMRVENLKAAQDQDRHAEDGDPMAQTGGKPMAVHEQGLHALTVTQLEPRACRPRRWGSLSRMYRFGAASISRPRAYFSTHFASRGPLPASDLWARSPSSAEPHPPPSRPRRLPLDSDPKQVGQPPLRVSPSLRAHLAEDLVLRPGPERPRGLQGSPPCGRESHRLDASVGVRNTLGHSVAFQAV